MDELSGKLDPSYRIQIKESEALWLYNMIQRQITEAVLRGHPVSEYQPYTDLIRRLKNAANA